MRDHRRTSTKEPQPSFLERATAFLKTGTGVVAALTGLIVAVAGLVTAVSKLRGDGGSAPPAAAHSSAPAANEDASDAELRSHIPSAIAPTCVRSTDAEPGAISAFNCTYRRIINLQYNLFPTTADLRDGYAVVKRRYGLVGTTTGDTCAAGKYEGEYREGGSVLCFVETKQDGVAAIVWSDPKLDILTFAWRTDRKLRALYDAWKAGVGPE